MTIECSTLWKQNKKNYHWCFVDEIVDWFHRKSALRIGFSRCWIFIDDDVFRRDVGWGVTVGRYSLNADNVNGGKTRIKQRNILIQLSLIEFDILSRCILNVFVSNDWPCTVEVSVLNNDSIVFGFIRSARSKWRLLVEWWDVLVTAKSLANWIWYFFSLCLRCIDGQREKSLRGLKNSSSSRIGYLEVFLRKVNDFIIKWNWNSYF